MFKLNGLKKYAVMLLALGLAFAGGRYLTPEKVIEKQSVKTEIEYITREIRASDGTITKEVIKRDVVEKTKEKIVESSKPNYKVTLIPKYSIPKKEITYGASIEKRILGPIFGGIYADTEKNIGLTVSLEF